MDERPLRRALQGHRVIGLDSCVLIYHLEDHPTFGGPAGFVLRHAACGAAAAVLSTLAVLEALVGPYRSGKDALAHGWYALFQQLSNVRLVGLTLEVADLAARLRAQHRLRTPDAIHVATAVACGATAFVTNDRGLPAVPDLDYVILADFARP